ncbi:Transmembrane protein 245 [Schistosoma japonicum]|nr:Transmembrane protein 245 [Schistosoma japonicum]
MEPYENSPFGFEQYFHLSYPQIKAIRQAFYNAAAFIILSFICVAILAVYYTLQVFVKPLLWAVLCGTVLYPFKNSLTDVIRGWVRRVDAEDQLLLVETVIVPFRVSNALYSILTKKVSDHWSLLRTSLFLLLALHIFSYFDYFYLPGLCINASYSAASFIDYVVESTSFMLVTILGVFYGIFALVRPFNFYFMYSLSHLFWLSLLLWCSSFGGVLRLPVFLSSVAVLAVGYWGFTDEGGRNHQERWASCHTVTTLDDGSTEQIRSAVSCDALSDVNVELHNSFDSSAKVHQNQTEEEGQRLQTGPPLRWSQFLRQAFLPITTGSAYGFDPVSELRAFMSEQLCLSSAKSWTAILDGRFRETSSSFSKPGGFFDAAYTNSSSFVNRCFLALFWAHFLVAIWLYQWPLYVICFVLIFFGIFRLSVCLKLQELSYWILHKLTSVLQTVTPNLTMEQRKAYLSSIVPKPVYGLLTMLAYCDRKLCRYLDSWLDSVVSLFILVFFVFTFCLLTMFLAFQIHNESIHLVSLTSDFINKALNSEAYSWLPKREQVDGMFGVLVTNAYQAGRSWISDKINELFEADPNSKAILKEQLLYLWEIMYNSFINQPTNSTVTTNESIVHNQALSVLLHDHTDSNAFTPRGVRRISFNRFFINTTWIFNRHALSSLFVVFRQNLGTLATITESLWSLVRSNLHLIAQLITALISLIMSGGHVAMNFMIAFLIFLTVLYYVLAASGSCYLPVAFIASLTPTSSGTNSLITHLYSTVELAISGIFVATLKLALFYGLYTSLTHIIFGLDLVVIPSVLAAILGAVPIIGTYWAVLPGVIEIIIIRHSLSQAGLLILFHLLPTYVVDVAVYREIKGAGHPYFTGLAIAGGIYCQGPEGAIIGPILLCCFMVGMNMFRWAMDSSKKALSINRCDYKSHCSPPASPTTVHTYQACNSSTISGHFRTVNSFDKHPTLSTRFRRPIFKRRPKYRFNKNSLSMPDISDISDESNQTSKVNPHIAKVTSPVSSIRCAHTSTPAHENIRAFK